MNLLFLAPIVVLLLVVILSCLKRAPSNRAYVITGFRSDPKILIGKAGLKLPFLERCDELDISQITIKLATDEYVPTRDFINIKVEAVVQIAVDTSTDGILRAMQHFLNEDKDGIESTACQTLLGNLREIVGTMNLKDLCQDKAKFSEEVKEKARCDMEGLGLVILAFNVQSVKDKEGLIENLGIENTEQIRKDAAIAKAIAERDVQVAQAEAKNASNEADTKSKLAIAERNNTLSIRTSELKISEDTKKAEANAAFKIQEAISLKSIEMSSQDAKIAKQEKEIELQKQEVGVMEQRLDAEVRKKADAERYAKEQEAEAVLYTRQKEAEAKLFEQEKAAVAVRKMGEAEADAIRMKGEAEAAALDKKADAMKKYGQAAILEMVVGILPDMARAVAEPISAIDKVTIVGGNSDGVSDMAGNVPVMLAKVMESVKETTGFDLTEVMKADTYDAKVNRNVALSGNVSLDKPDVDVSDESSESDRFVSDFEGDTCTVV